MGLGRRIPAPRDVYGGRYHFDDDQETPDTGVAAYDFGTKGIVWDDSSCLTRQQEAHPFVSFYWRRRSALDQWRRELQGF